MKKSDLTHGTVVEVTNGTKFPTYKAVLEYHPVGTQFTIQYGVMKTPGYLDTPIIVDGELRSESFELIKDNTAIVSKGTKFKSPHIGKTATKPSDQGNGKTKAGLEMTKNGRLKLKHPRIPNDDIVDGLTVHGFEYPEVGDWILYASNGMLSSGTVGKVIKYAPIGGGFGSFDRASFNVHMLDGHVEGCWADCAVKLTKDQVQEVIDFYIADGRPQRVLLDI